VDGPAQSCSWPFWPLASPCMPLPSATLMKSPTHYGLYPRESPGLPGAFSRLGRSSVTRPVFFLRATDRAVHVQDEERKAVWLPKSQIRNLAEIENLGQGEHTTIEVSPWIAQKVGWV
jgi:hypothetical protein